MFIVVLPLPLTYTRSLRADPPAAQSFRAVLNLWGAVLNSGWLRSGTCVLVASSSSTCARVIFGRPGFFPGLKTLNMKVFLVL